MSSIDEKGLEAATIELLSHRGEHPRRVLRGGSELWETYLPAMRAAITAYLSALPATSRDDALEEAAKVADELRKASTPGMPLFGAGMCNAADQIATAIRQLRSKE